MPFTPRLVFVTASSMEEARNLTQFILERHLAACVNLHYRVESHYCWKGKLEKSAEVMMIIKSSAEKFQALAELIKRRHSYKCPEIVAVVPGEMSADYYKWWEGEMQIAPSS
jgi:periplasmic divalent cation tolerance protein